MAFDHQAKSAILRKAHEYRFSGLRRQYGQRPGQQQGEGSAEQGAKRSGNTLMDVKPPSMK
jgi:hypothetical protein